MSTRRTSLWSVLPPRDAECDLFAPEIAKWMSIVLERDISSDLVTELEKGDLLCELFIKLCPNERFGKYHRNAMMDIWKRDNMKLFADATNHYGVPKSALMNYSYFESKNEAMIITSLLVFVKVLIEKQGAEAIHLPESFIKTICSAYLETRILHKSSKQPKVASPNEPSKVQTEPLQQVSVEEQRVEEPKAAPENESIGKEAVESTQEQRIESTTESNVEESSELSNEPLNEPSNEPLNEPSNEPLNESSIESSIEPSAENHPAVIPAISEEEQAQLEKIMQLDVNDMLKDILKERRKTYGMVSSQESSEESEDSDDSVDSFEEKYLPRSSHGHANTATQVEEAAMKEESVQEEREVGISGMEEKEDALIAESSEPAAEEKEPEAAEEPNAENTDETTVKTEEEKKEEKEEEEKKEEKEEEEKEETKETNEKNGGHGVFWKITVLTAMAAAGFIIVKQMRK